MTLFSHESNIMKVLKLTLFITGYSVLKDWALSRTHIIFAVAGSSPSRSWLDFPLSQILWKYTRSQCLWSDIPMLKEWAPSASYTMFFWFVPFTFMTCLSHQIKRYESTQGQCFYDPIFQCWNTQFHQQATLSSIHAFHDLISPIGLMS